MRVKEQLEDIVGEGRRLLRARTEDAGWRDGRGQDHGRQEGIESRRTWSDKSWVRSNTSSSEHGGMGVDKIMGKVKRDCNMEGKTFSGKPY